MARKKNKLKHADDYRHKITKDSQRFKDKVHKKSSKLSDEKFKKPDEQNTKDILKKKRLEKELRKNQAFKGKSKPSAENRNDERATKNANETENYDPIGQDLDNDGIIDRYDNDFRDSDYFESTYDVEDRLQLDNKSKALKAKKKRYKRKNYTDALYTRKNTSDKVGGIKDDVNKKISKNNIGGDKSLTDKLDLKKNIAVSSVYLGVGKTSEHIRDYLARGSDENAGVEAGEKAADITSKLTHGVKKFSDKRKAKKEVNLAKKGNVKSKQTSKLKFTREKKLKTNKEFQKMKAYKKSVKKKQMKKAISKHKKKSIKNRVKKSLTKFVRAIKNIATSKWKLMLGVILGLILLLVIMFQFASTSIMAILNSTTSVASTTYLSDKEVLKSINQEFSSLESALNNEISSVEDNYPDYDEYILNNTEYIGHNVHELLSYITARFGEVKNVSEIRPILKEMFNAMYRLEYKEDIETRYRTVTETYLGEDGNEYTVSYEESYEYKKLIVTLHKKEMDTIIKEVFADYPDNLKHYEALFLAQGNMAETFGNTALIAANGGVGGGAEYEASAEIQKKIVNAAYITPSPGAGWCAMWVSQVYQNAGLGYVGGNACDMYRNYTFTSDRSKLKVGMLVAVESSSSGSQAGLTYGHVGIYIGDGKVIDNIGHIRVTTLDDWIATFCKHHPVGYGFPPSVQK